MQGVLVDWLVGMPILNDRTSEFPHGDNLNITQIGQREVQDYTENTAVEFSGIDLDRINLNITDFKQTGFYITDTQKQDAALWESAWNQNMVEQSLAIERQQETATFAICNQQSLGSPNAINGRAHRRIGTGTVGGNSNRMTIDDIRHMKLAFDEARVPAEGRVLFVDSTVEFDLNDLIDITKPATGDLFNNNLDGMVNTGLGNRLNFSINIHGFNIMIAHTLPRLASETIGGTTVTNAVCNIAMSMASSDHLPFMGVMRQRPDAEHFRNVSLRRDEYSSVYRYGHAVQRFETLGVILTNRD